MAKNSFFRFKQFTVQQADAAMKVGTDGILLGAWVNIENCSRILDVGTGTGLITLMLAQRCNASISAIEIEENAALQARDNVAASKWKSNINVEHISLQAYEKKCFEKFDLIVSNPPFFNRSLKAKSEERTLARHTCSLPFDELIQCSCNLLSESGRLALILPKNESEIVKEQALRLGLFVIRETNIQPKPGKQNNRVLLEFAKQQYPILKDRLTIYSITGSGYSEEYKALTKDFYLNH